MKKKRIPRVPMFHFHCPLLLLRQLPKPPVVELGTTNTFGPQICHNEPRIKVEELTPPQETLLITDHASSTIPQMEYFSQRLAINPLTNTDLPADLLSNDKLPLFAQEDLQRVLKQYKDARLAMINMSKELEDLQERLDNKDFPSFIYEDVKIPNFTPPVGLTEQERTEIRAFTEHITFSNRVMILEHVIKATKLAFQRQIRLANEDYCISQLEESILRDVHDMQLLTFRSSEYVNEVIKQSVCYLREVIDKHLEPLC